MTWTQLRFETGLSVDAKTFNRILDANGITYWRALKRLRLTKDDATRRLNWAEARAFWTAQDWAQIVFSNEMSCERGAGGKPKWVFRRVDEKYDPKIIQTANKGKGIRVMVWAAIVASQKTNLHVLDRDFESKKHGYTS